MATELTLVVWVDGDIPVPTTEELEESLNVHVVEYDEEEC